MKKIIILIIAIIITLPTSIKAEEIVIQDETLKEACDELGLTCNHNQQDINPLAPNMYIFIGEKCTYCNELLVFLSDIYDTYNNRANFVVFNVSKDTSNYGLFKTVAQKYNDEGKSIPFIAIDNKYFSGFEEKDRQNIIISIEKAYDTKERYDVVGDIMNGNYEPIEKENNQIIPLITIIALIVIVSSSLGIYLYINNKKETK